MEARIGGRVGAKRSVHRHDALQLLVEVLNDDDASGGTRSTRARLHARPVAGLGLQLRRRGTGFTGYLPRTIGRT